MEIALAIIGFICILVGLAGAVLPLPGPPLSFIGMLILQYSGHVHFSDSILWGFGIATVAVTILDYYVPIWGTKKFGGSKYGSWGSGIGLLIGMFLGPFGLFIGAFAGAFIGEFLFSKNTQTATKSAIGSFLGLVSGIFIKVVLCLGILGFSIYQLFV